MSDERAYPAWGYCTHPGFWYQGYWYCLDEQCEYRCESGDGTFGYGGATAYDEWGGDHQPGSEQGQDASHYAQQYDNHQQDNHQQDDHWYYNQDGGQDDVGQGDYDDPPNAEQPVPPSDAATTGSWSSAAQTHSPSSTETPDNEDASMFGNADEDTEHREDREDRTLSYVQGGNGGGQGVDDVPDWFPECDVGDTKYPRKLSI